MENRTRKLFKLLWIWKKKNWFTATVQVTSYFIWKGLPIPYLGPAAIAAAVWLQRGAATWRFWGRSAPSWPKRAPMETQVLQRSSPLPAPSPPTSPCCAAHNTCVSFPLVRNALSLLTPQVWLPFHGQIAKLLQNQLKSDHNSFHLCCFSLRLKEQSVHPVCFLQLPSCT